MMALWRAGDNDPGRANLGRLLDIGWELLGYASSHDNTFPNDIDVVLAHAAKPALDAKSLVTGRPYVYVAAGEKMPTKSSEREQFVLLYDDVDQNGYHPCVTAAPMGTAILVDDLKEQMKKRGKSHSSETDQTNR